MDLASMFTELVALEQQVSDAAKAADPRDEMRVYPWRPSGYPELPAIWNWIDDGDYEIEDTATGTDIIIVKVTIGVRPADLGETMDRLVLLTDHFRAVVNPALWDRGANLPLNGTVRRAKRVLTRSDIDTFPLNGTPAPVMCMDQLIRVELPQTIA